MYTDPAYGESFGRTVGGTFAGAIARIVGFLPHLVAAAVILAVGLLIAYGLGLLTRKLFHGLGFDRFLEHHEVVRRPGERRASNLSGRVAFWVVALVTFVAAADALNLAWVTTGLARVTAYLPNVLAAALVALGAFILGNIAFRALARSRPEASLLWPRTARAGIYVLAGFMAIQELNIATSIVTLCFALLVGSLAIAAAISFGIGNFKLAGEITREWYRRSRPMLTIEEEGTPHRIDTTSQELPPEPRH